MSEATIDSLSIEINSKSSNASKGILELSNSVKELRSSVSGGTGGLSRLANNINSLNKSISTSSFSNLSGLANSLKPLENIGKTTNFASAINKLKKIPEISKSLDASTLQTFTQKIKSLTQALVPLATQMEKVSAGFIAFPSKIAKVNSATQKSVLKSKSGTGGLLSGIFGGMGLTKMFQFGALATGITSVGRVIGSFINKSNAYVEDLNLFNVAMGKSANIAKEWVDNVSEALGLDPSNMMRYMGVFQMITTGFGLSSDAAYKMSKNLTQLSYDREMSCYIVIYNKKRGEPVYTGCEQYLIAC